MKTKQKETKIFVVEVWGKSNTNEETVTVPYIFTKLEYAKKFIIQEEKNRGFNYGSWTQRGAYIRNENGQSFDDKYVK